jgi:hypothetical protein
MQLQPRIAPSPSPDTVLLDQLRTQWLAAIFESGPIAAREDAVLAFIERMQCSQEVAEDLVDRAWCMLKLNVHASFDTWPAHWWDKAVVSGKVGVGQV